MTVCQTAQGPYDSFHQIFHPLFIVAAPKAFGALILQRRKRMVPGWCEWLVRRHTTAGGKNVWILPRNWGEAAERVPFSKSASGGTGHTLGVRKGAEGTTGSPGRRIQACDPFVRHRRRRVRYCS